MVLSANRISFINSYDLGEAQKILSLVRSEKTIAQKDLEKKWLFKIIKYNEKR